MFAQTIHQEKPNLTWSFTHHLEFNDADCSINENLKEKITTLQQQIYGLSFANQTKSRGVKALKKSVNFYEDLIHKTKKILDSERTDHVLASKALESKIIQNDTTRESLTEERTSIREYMDLLRSFDFWINTIDPIWGKREELKTQLEELKAKKKNLERELKAAQNHLEYKRRPLGGIIGR